VIKHFAAEAEVVVGVADFRRGSERAFLIDRYRTANGRARIILNDRSIKPLARCPDWVMEAPTVFG
jgi:hypothetical protein